MPPLQHPKRIAGAVSEGEHDVTAAQCFAAREHHFFTTREIGCYGVNDPERMKHLAALGLWGFVTDVPDIARAALGPSA